MPFMDQILDQLSQGDWYCIFDGYLGITKYSLLQKTKIK